MFGVLPKSNCRGRGRSRSNPAVSISQRVRPIESIGCYIPGGRFALVSTLLMTVDSGAGRGREAHRRRLPAPNRRAPCRGQPLGRHAKSPASAARKPSPLSLTVRKASRAWTKSLGRQSLRHRRQATRQQRLRNRSSRRAHRSDCSGTSRQPTLDCRRSCSRKRSMRRMPGVFLSRLHAHLLATSSAKSRSNCGASRKQILRIAPISPAGAILLAPSMSAACDFVNRFAPEHLSLPDDGHALMKRFSPPARFFSVLERATFRRLRQRQQSRPAHWGLGARARRPSAPRIS